MSFKDISYLELWRPFCSVVRNHLCNFGRGYQEVMSSVCQLINYTMQIQVKNMLVMY